MKMLQWIGVALTIVGLIFNNYKNFQIPVRQNQQQVQQTIQYSTINIAYDHATGKHYFQHGDGRWYEFPPKP
jgi:hypothetical protein